MLGIKKDVGTIKYKNPAIGAASNTNLVNLRKSVLWESNRTHRTEALQERLEELLVFELKKDGDMNYLHLSVRGLYKHVLAAITRRTVTSGKTGEQDTADQRQSPNEFDPVTASLQDTIRAAPLPLGLALTAPLGDEPSSSTAPSSSAAFTTPLKPPAPRRYRSGSVPVTGLTVTGKHGFADPSANATVSYRERLGGYLHPRDMRRLVTPFSASNEPELIVRRHVMLLNFDPLRAIVLRDRLLVLVPDGADSLLVTLEQRVRGGTAGMEKSIFGGDKKNHDNTYADDMGRTNHSEQNSVSKSKGGSMISRFIRKSGKLVAKHSQDGTIMDSNRGTVSRASSAVTEEGGETADDNDDSDEHMEWDEMEGREWIDLPFELQCVDAVLHVVCSILSEDTFELEEAAQAYIKRLLTDNGGVNDDPLTIMRAIKDAVREMSSRVKGFVQSMNRILDEDEDMALMNLSRLLTHPERFIQPVPHEVLEEESDEPELILEAHLQTGLTLTNALDLIKGQIDTASELVDQKLDAIRNRILYANMVISVLTLCVTVAATVGSIFGMNLSNKLEESDTAFVRVTFGTLAGTIILGFSILLILAYSGTIPRVTAPSAG